MDILDPKVLINEDSHINESTMTAQTNRDEFLIINQELEVKPANQL